VPGDSSTPGNGEPERLKDPLGLLTPGIRFPYISRLALCPSAGAPNPKLPRGIGTPPFDSNLAIFERRLPTGLLAGDEGLETGVDWDKGCCGADTLRCWRAAMRSFKFPAGGVCILEQRQMGQQSWRAQLARLPRRGRRGT